MDGNDPSVTELTNCLIDSHSIDFFILVEKSLRVLLLLGQQENTIVIKKFTVATVTEIEMGLLQQALLDLCRGEVNVTRKK